MNVTDYSQALDIKALFEPQAIAVVGASTNRSKIGYKIIENIVSGGYAGRIYPVNPKGGEILGLRIYRSLTEIEADVDVACLTIPADFVFEAVKACAAKRVKYIPIISSGFSEIGHLEAEKQIVTYAHQHDMRVLGPNIFGLYSAPVSLNATFGSGQIRAGNVAIITQSGALGIAMIGKTASENIGLSAIVSVGNKADIDEADLLSYLAHHDDTKTILMYIEGVKAGAKFIEAVRQATQQKPVVVIKSGRSKKGAVAAASHTGSLAGADEIFDDIMRQCGVLRAESLQEAFDWCKYLADAPQPQGKHTVIITNGGGVGVMATDACEKYGVALYDKSNALAQIFSEVTPEFGSTKNPIDLTGQATSRHYDTALDTALEDQDINAVMALYCETAVFDAENLSSMIQTNYTKYKAGKKPIVFSALGGKSVEQAVVSLRKKRVPVFADVYEAVSCLGTTYFYQRYLQHQSGSMAGADLDVGAIEAITQAALQEGRTFLLAHEAQQVMNIAGIVVPQSHIARNLDEAVKYAETIGYPVVMKVVSRDILHKSDAGGVALDLEDKAEAMDAYQAILHSCRSYQPAAVIAGVEVSEMVQPGIEVIIGARRDITFGPIVMFGLGGIYVEVLKDVSFRALPLDRQEAISMIEQTKAYPLLLGVRGEARKDIDVALETLMKLARIIEQCRSITDIEINPLVVYDQGQGVKAVDVRVLVSNIERGEPYG